MKKRNLLLPLFAIAITFTSTTFFESAKASTDGSTNVTFVINSYSGGLAITVPADVIFTSMTSPYGTETVTATATQVAVTDTRRGNGITWSTTAVASELTSGGGDTITASAMSYATGIIAQTTAGSFISVEHDQASLLSAVQIASSSSIIGNHIASWTPSLTLTVPSRQIAGTYTGTITHSVS